MNSYMIGGTSKTANNLVIAGLFASTFISGHIPEQHREPPKTVSGRYVAQNNGSIGSITPLVGAENRTIGTPDVHISVDIEQVLAGFFQDLLANQEELGKEVSSALYNNLWDIYAV